MCGRAISRTRNLHGTIRRLMRVGGFFVLLVRLKLQPEERKTKSEDTYRNRVVRSVNRRGLRAGPCEWLLSQQGVEPSAGLRCKVQSIMRASSRSVPAATALPGCRPKRPEIRPSKKRSRQSLTVFTLQDWLRLTAANLCPPAKPRIIDALRASSARPL